jgi:transposase
MMKSLSSTTMGIDLGKNSVHVVAMDGSGTVVLRKRLSHAKLVVLLANSPPSLARVADENGPI